MPSSDVKVPDSQLFRERAPQYRSLASFFSEPARALLLEVAADYERMTDHAAKFKLEEINRVRSS
jgi:hypothetical protein